MSSPTLSTLTTQSKLSQKLKKFDERRKTGGVLTKVLSELYSFHKLIETNNVQWYTIPCVNSKYEFTLNTN